MPASSASATLYYHHDWLILLHMVLLLLSHWDCQHTPWHTKTGDVAHTSNPAWGWHKVCHHWWSTHAGSKDGGRGGHTQPGGSAPREQSSCATVLPSNHVACGSLLYSLLAVMRHHSWFCGLIVWPHCLPRPGGSCAWLFGRSWTWYPPVGCDHGCGQAICGGSWSRVPGVRNIPCPQILIWPHHPWRKWVSCHPLGQTDDSQPILDSASCSCFLLFIVIRNAPAPLVPWPVCLAQMLTMIQDSFHIHFPWWQEQGRWSTSRGVGNVGALISRESCSVCYPNLPQILYGVEPHRTGSSVGLRGWHAWGASKIHTTKENDHVELNWMTRPWKWFANLLGAMLSMVLDNWTSLTLQGP